MLDKKRLQGMLEDCSFLKVDCRETVDSTNTLIRQAAQDGAEEGLVISAEQQTAGRGRRGRSWVSPPGSNLYFSVLLRPRQTAKRRIC